MCRETKQKWHCWTLKCFRHWGDTIGEVGIVMASERVFILVQSNNASSGLFCPLISCFILFCLWKKPQPVGVGWLCLHSNKMIGKSFSRQNLICIHFQFQVLFFFFCFSTMDSDVVFDANCNGIYVSKILQCILFGTQSKGANGFAAEDNAFVANLWSKCVRKVLCRIRCGFREGMRMVCLTKTCFATWRTPRD